MFVLIVYGQLNVIACLEPVTPVAADLVAVDVGSIRAIRSRSIFQWLT